MFLSFSAAQLIPLYQIKSSFSLEIATNISIDGFPNRCSSVEFLNEAKVTFDDENCIRVSASVGNKTVLLRREPSALVGKCFCAKECTLTITMIHNLNDIDCIDLYHHAKQAIPINGEVYLRLRNDTNIDGIAAEKAEINMFYWIFIFIPILGYLFFFGNFFIFLTVSKGENPLNFTLSE